MPAYSTTTDSVEGMNMLIMFLFDVSAPIILFGELNIYKDIYIGAAEGCEKMGLNWGDSWAKVENDSQEYSFYV